MKQKWAFQASRTLISPPPFGRWMTSQGSCTELLPVGVAAIALLLVLLELRVCSL